MLAAAVYGKRVDFSGGDDATVRNDARRLRDKLREYYAESARDPIIVTLPKGAYTPTFEANAQSPLPTIVPMRAPEAPAMAKPRWTAAILAAAGCLALAIGYWTWSRTGRNDKPTSWNVEQVTSIPGFEGPPSLSPDGNSVAFSSEDRAPAGSIPHLHQGSAQGGVAAPHRFAGFGYQPGVVSGWRRHRVCTSGQGSVSGFAAGRPGAEDRG